MRATTAFNRIVAWLAQRTDKTTITRLLRVSWEAVATIVEHVVADELDESHTDSETVEILNSAGLRPGVTERFSPKILYLLRRTYGLEDHYTRLRRRGLLTLAEISELLGAHPSTVKAWALAGHIPSHVYNDKGQRLFERPSAMQRHCQWCGDLVSATPALRRGKKWCSPRYAQAAYHRRKRESASSSYRSHVA